MNAVSPYRNLAYAMLIIGLSLSCLIAFETYQYEKSHAQAVYEKDSVERIMLIEDELNDSLDILEQINAFYAASNYVSNEEFERYVSVYLRKNESLDFSAWVPRIKSSEKDEFEKRTGITIKPLVDEDLYEKDFQKADYFPIEYIKAPIEMTDWYGIDFYSSQKFADDIKHAAEKERTILSYLLKAPGNNDYHSSLIFHPIYENESVYGTDDERWQNLKGVIVTSHQIHNLVKKAFVALKPTGNHIAIFDVTDSSEHQYIYRDQSRIKNANYSLQELPTITALKKRGYYSRIIEYGARRWEIICIPEKSLWSLLRFREPWTMLVVGSIFSWLIFVLLQLLGRNKEYIEQQVKLRTSELMQTREELLKEIDERNHAEEKLKLFIKSAPVAVAMFDKDMRYMLTSQMWLDVFDLGPSIVGQSHYDIFPEIKENKPEWIQIHQECLSGACRKGEDSFVRKNGDTEWLKWEIQPWFLKDDQVGGITIFTENVTAIKKAEMRYKRKDELTQQSQKLEALGRLSGGVAHDFNNALTVIKGFGYFLKKALIDKKEETKYVEEILIASEKAARLTDQLLTFSRKQVQEVETVNMIEVFSSFEDMLKRLIGAEYALDLKFKVDHAWCEIDQNQFEQVIMNVAVNAMDAMPEGGKLSFEVDVKMLEKSYVEMYKDIPPGEYIKISISDTGTGINDDALQHIFEPFFTTKEKGKGTGLGLATSFGIIKQHKGHMSVKTQVGKGTTFMIYLPRVKAQEKHKATKSIEIDKILPRGNAKVLLCEDESALRYVAKEILTKHGYEVMEAYDGQDAWKKMQELKGNIDIVVTDVIMPRMGGRDLLNKVKEDFPNVPVLLMSGYTDNFIGMEDLVEGYIDFLRKPFRPEEFLLKVYELLENSKEVKDE